MERKIGEIFEYNGEWYQCIRSILTCSSCEIPRPCTKIRELGYCSSNMRNDKEQVVFRKLEKVGEPFTGKVHIQLQRYKIYTKPIVNPTENVGYINEENTIVLEIKQNKEDMSNTETLWYGPDKKEAKSLKLSNLKPFSLEAAKQGKPVCTRDGRKARIICFDAKDTQPIIGLYEKDINGITREYLCSYHIDGRMYDDQDSGFDLMMLPEKKEGWVNIYYEHDVPSHREVSWVYDKEEEAIKIGKELESCYIATTRIEWEE